ncbi:MAG: posphoenolpyruvate synthetase regulatory kinase/phosphorylase PpsR [Pseudomonadota bacterium]
MSKRFAFFVSDGTGLTAEALGLSLLSQFEHVEFERITLPFIDSVDKAREAVVRIEASRAESDGRPLVFDTIVNQEVRAELARADAFLVDIFGTFLKPLEHELSTHSSYSVGKSHAISDRQAYKTRMDAVHFALDNDDGARTRHYDQADILLVGVSRSGKTPTSLYLALQYGLRAANYPLTEDDLDGESLPKVLKPYKSKIFGLLVDADRLSAIRNERMPNSRYASIQQCQMEVRAAETIYKREGLPYLDVTELSIEEISSRILQITGQKKKLC